MPANMHATSVAAPQITQAEFEIDRAAVQQFALGLVQELFENPDQSTFHLQIQAHTAPPAGGTAPIDQGDSVTITLHRR